MEYLEEFQAYLDSQDFAGFLRLWEEYCAGGDVNGLELVQILEYIKHSPFAAQFGKHVELALPLWEQLKEDPNGHPVLRLIVDLQTSNNKDLALLTVGYIKNLWSDEEFFNEKIRLIGLRSGEKFQRAIRNYELLSHMNKGNFVYHTGGWGTGEIIDVSLVREQLVLEFEYVVGRKDIPFEKAFSYLIPLPKEHFLSRRFGDPDLLEAEGKRDPVSIVRLLLKDLGPKTALEIKDELCELVIPQDDWSKWWQSVRAKVKKDTMIETPANIREPFRLRSKEVSHEERLRKALKKKEGILPVLQTIYSFLRDFPEILKEGDTKNYLKELLLEKLDTEGVIDAERLQILLLLQEVRDKDSNEYSIDDLILELTHVRDVVNAIEIGAIKKRVLVAVKRLREDWPEIFGELFLSIPQNALRDYLLKSLDSEGTRSFLSVELERLLENGSRYPEAFIWYFQKEVISPESNIDKERQCRFFEQLLVLLNGLEADIEHRDLVKKVYTILTAGRYAAVRQVLEDCSERFAKEFLLLITKCRTFTNHDISILNSLVEVVHPSLAAKKDGSKTDEDNLLWATKEAYETMHEKLRKLATVVTVENAKEIEEARALGDLRENAEYKSALERRTQIQALIKQISDQLDHTRILTEQDISTNEAGIGTRIKLEKGGSGEFVEYTLLGPWDADTDRNILSVQSRFARALEGHHVGETIEYQGEEFVVKGIASVFE